MSEKNEIKIIRIYDAPVKVVWDAWTDPAQVAQWWGPRGFSLTTHSKDLRAGGTWVYTMHGPDGVDYPNKTQYFVVEECSKLVYDHGGNDDRPPLFRVTVLFSEELGKTRMEMSMTLPSPEALNETKKFIKKAGGDATWDRLAEYLEKKSTNKEKFVINRSFDVPLDLMFDMWTKKEHLEQWSGPIGSSTEYYKCEIKPGGRAFYSMTSPNVKMYGRVEYLKIEKPDTIIYKQEFCDENENISRHPFVPVWPETMLTTVKLAAEAPGRTRVTVTWELLGTVTTEELDVFIKFRTSMTQGWTGSFDRLESYASN